MKPRICLNMIVRNESAIIERALLSMLPLISHYEILDTGSSDDTIERIVRFFASAGVSGNVHRGEFVNFSQARNDALDRCRASAAEFDYILLADADMVLQVLDDTALATLRAPAYLVRQRNAISYLNVRLLRRDLAARYVGATHEYIDLAGESAEPLPAIEFFDHADGGNRPDKFARDIALLSGYLAEHPGDARSLFYLAQSYRDAGRLPEAIATYAQRVAAGGWDEEAWYAQFQMALCQRNLGNRAAFVAGCLTAYDRRPGRAEPLHELAKHYREQGEYQTALLFAGAAAQIAYPAADLLFIDEFVYRTGCAEELAICGFYSSQPSQRRAGALACDALALGRDCPEPHRSNARHNLRFYAQSPVELFGAVDWTALDVTLPEPFVAMNPSVAAGGDGALHAVLRGVNYRIAEGGAYLMQPEGSPVRTQNWLAALDAALQPAQLQPMQDATGRVTIAGARIIGFEDCRLFRWRDGWWASATVRDEDASEHAAMRLLQLDDSGAIRHRWQLHGYGTQEHEKNWMPCVRGDELLFVYGCDPVTVLRVASFDGEVAQVDVMCRQPPALALEHLRGGSQLIPFDDGWLAVTHEVIYLGSTRQYLHRFVEFAADFQVRRLSMPFFLRREGIEFVAGLARDGDSLLLSFGVHDGQAWLARVPEHGVRAALQVA